MGFSPSTPTDLRGCPRGCPLHRRQRRRLRQALESARAQLAPVAEEDGLRGLVARLRELRRLRMPVGSLVDEKEPPGKPGPSMCSAKQPRRDHYASAAVCLRRGFLGQRGCGNRDFSMMRNISPEENANASLPRPCGSRGRPWGMLRVSIGFWGKKEMGTWRAEQKARKQRCELGARVEGADTLKSKVSYTPFSLGPRTSTGCPVFTKARRLDTSLCLAIAL